MTAKDVNCLRLRVPATTNCDRAPHQRAIQGKGTRNMQYAEIRPGVAMAYADDCFAPPWTSSQTIVMVHGNAKSSRAWTAFVPHLAGKYRVVRPDMPGFGASPEPPVIAGRWTSWQTTSAVSSML